MPSQAQKHVTHNEAIRMLDVMVHTTVKDIHLEELPSNPQEGEGYIIAQNARQPWNSKANTLAFWQDGAWVYYQPKSGWRVYVLSLSQFYVFENSAWVEYVTQQSGRLAINAEESADHQLVVGGNSTLLDSEGAGHRLYINKSVTNETASIIFQNAYTGHVEFGLAGSNQFSIRVSADGNSFLDALVIDNETGIVTMPNTPQVSNNNTNGNLSIGASAGNLGEQALPTNTYTTITGWQLKDSSLSDSTFDNGVLIIGPESAGRYMFGLTAVVKSTSASVAVRIRRGSSDIIGHAQANGEGALFASASLASSALLVAGDEVHFEVWHNHGSEITIHSVSTMSFTRL